MKRTSGDIVLPKSPDMYSYTSWEALPAMYTAIVAKNGKKKEVLREENKRANAARRMYFKLSAAIARTKFIQ